MNSRAKIQEMVQASADKLNPPAAVIETPVEDESSNSIQELTPDNSVTPDNEEVPDIVVPQQTGKAVDYEKRLRDKEVYAQQRASEADSLRRDLEARDRALQNLQLSLIQERLRQAPPEPEDLTEDQIVERRIEAAVERKLAALGANPTTFTLVNGIGEWASFVTKHPEAAQYENLITKTLERFPGVKRDLNGFESAYSHVLDLKALAENAPSVGSQGEAASAPKTNAKAPLSAQRKEALSANANRLATAGETSVPVDATPKRTVNKNASPRVQIEQMVARSYDKLVGS